jgi:uroporphyrinogen decarboxylase
LKPLLDVLSGRLPSRRPVWLMRQAGRYLPEYRALRREAGSFLELCYDPVKACEVTLQPLRRFDVDAAILFSDILVVPHAMGLELDFVENEGPKLSTVGDDAGVLALKDGVGSPYFEKVWETVARVAAEVGSSRGLIGFCGGPWTVASYMIEGGSSDRLRAVGVAVENPSWFAALLDLLVEVSAYYLLGQIRAGAEVVQIFDSWAGDIPAASRQRVVIDPIRRIVDIVRASYPGFPVIVFARGVGDGHGAMASGTAASCVGVEQGVALKVVLDGLAAGVAVQGNLAPDALLASPASLEEQTLAVLRDVPMQRHIFNLGHGIVPQVNPDQVTSMLSVIRRHDGLSS